MEILCRPGFKDTKVEYSMKPGRLECRANITMNGNRSCKIRIDTLSTVAPPLPPLAFQIARQAIQAGSFENLNSLDIAESETLTAASDMSIVFIDNTKEFESESFDQEQLGLIITDRPF
jgi:beta-glucosidase